jgi:hypothetical protein
VALGRRVTALDPLREHDLLGGGEQLVPADVGEEELQAVGGAGDRDGGSRRLLLRRLGRLLGRLLRRLGGRRRSGRRADLEPGALELACELFALVVVQLELVREGLDLGGIDEAALLRALDDGADLVGLEQFVELVLRQGSLRPFVLRRRFESLLTLGAKSSGYHPQHYPRPPGRSNEAPRKCIPRFARFVSLGRPSADEVCRGQFRNPCGGAATASPVPSRAARRAIRPRGRA